MPAAAAAAVSGPRPMVARRRSSVALHGPSSVAATHVVDAALHDGDDEAALPDSVPVVPMLPPRPAKALKLLAAAAWQFPPFDSLHIDVSVVGRGSHAATIPGATSAAAIVAKDASSARQNQPLHKSSQAKAITSAIFGESADMNVRGATPPSRLYDMVQLANPGNVFVVLEIIFTFWQLQAVVLSTAAESAIPATIRTGIGRLASLFALDGSVFLPDAAVDARKDADGNSTASAIAYAFDASAVLALVVVVVGLLVLRSASSRAAVLRETLGVCEYALKKPWGTDDASLRLKLRGAWMAVHIAYVPLLRSGAEIALCSERYTTTHAGDCATGYERAAGAAIALLLCPAIIGVAYRITVSNRRMYTTRFTSTGAPNGGSERDFLPALEHALRLNPGTVFASEYVRSWMPYRVATLSFAFVFVGTAVVFSAVSASSNSPSPSAAAATATATTSPAATDDDSGVGGGANIDGIDVPEAIKSAFIVLLLAQLLFLAAVAKLRPLLSAHATALDVASQLLGAGCTASVTVAVYGADADVAAIFYSVCAGAAVITTVGALFFTQRATRSAMRARLGQIRFTPVSDGDPTPLVFAPHRIDYAKERRERVWMPFWGELLSAADPFRVAIPAPDIEAVDGDIERKRDATSPERQTERANGFMRHFDTFIGEGRPACLLGYKGSVSERHAENKSIAATIGAANFDTATSRVLARAEADAVMVAVRVLHGPDCFVPQTVLNAARVIDTADAAAASAHYDETPRQYHHQKGSSRLGALEGVFGCLYVVPCPLAFFFRPDSGSGDAATPREVCIDVSALPAVVAANGDRDVLRRRVAREKVRAIALMCDEDGYVCHFVHRELVPPKSVGRCGAEDVVVSFDTGKLTLNADDGDVLPRFDPSVHCAHLLGSHGSDAMLAFPVVPAFSASLCYVDGGRVNDGGTGCSLDEEVQMVMLGKVVGHAELGLTDDLADTVELRWLVDSNARAVETGLERWRQRTELFRLHFASEFAAKTTALSSAFWPRVVANDHLPRDKLRKHLARYEANPALKQLALRGFDPIIEEVYWRLQYVDTCPALSVWVMFWHDVHTLNGRELGVIADNAKCREALDPRNVDSISWSICAKDDCNAWLAEVGLQEPGSGTGFISRTVVDKLYDAMSKAMCDEDAVHPGAPSAAEAEARRAKKKSSSGVSPATTPRAAKAVPTTTTKYGGSNAAAASVAAKGSSRPKKGGKQHTAVPVVVTAAGAPPPALYASTSSTHTTPPELTEPLRDRVFIEAAVLPLTDEHRFHHPILRLAPWAATLACDALPVSESAATATTEDLTASSKQQSSTGGTQWGRESIRADGVARRIMDVFPVLRWALEAHLLADDGSGGGGHADNSPAAVHRRRHTQVGAASEVPSASKNGVGRAEAAPRVQRGVAVVAGAAASPPSGPGGGTSSPPNMSFSAEGAGAAKLPLWTSAAAQGAGANAFMQGPNAASSHHGRRTGQPTPPLRGYPVVRVRNTSPAASAAAAAAMGRSGDASSSSVVSRPAISSSAAAGSNASVSLGSAVTLDLAAERPNPPGAAMPDASVGPKAPTAHTQASATLSFSSSSTASSSTSTLLSFRGRSPTPSDEAWPDECDDDDDDDGVLLSV